MYSYWVDAFLKNKAQIIRGDVPDLRGDLTPGKKCRPLLWMTMCFLITSEIPCPPNID